MHDADVDVDANVMCHILGQSIWETFRAAKPCCQDPGFGRILHEERQGTRTKISDKLTNSNDSIARVSVLYLKEVNYLLLWYLFSKYLVLQYINI